MSYISEKNIWCFSFWDWHISVSIIIFSSMHFLLQKTGFYSFYDWVIFHWAVIFKFYLKYLQIYGGKRHSFNVFQIGCDGNVLHCCLGHTQPMLNAGLNVNSSATNPSSCWCTREVTNDAWSTGVTVTHNGYMDELPNYWLERHIKLNTAATRGEPLELLSLLFFFSPFLLPFFSISLPHSRLLWNK